MRLNIGDRVRADCTGCKYNQPGMICHKKGTSPTFTVVSRYGVAPTTHVYWADGQNQWCPHTQVRPAPLGAKIVGNELVLEES